MQTNENGDVKCNHCNNFLNIDKFKHLKNQWYVCVDCNNIRRRKLYAADPERHIQYSKNHYNSNTEKILKKAQEYREKYPEVIKATNKRYRVSHPNNKIERRKIDINYRLKENLRTRVHHAIFGISKKSNTTMDLIGCTIEEFKIHLEKSFVNNMSWDNYGEWHIDHIIPCSLFDLTDPEEQRKCFNYKNQQALWAIDNIKKSNKI